MKISGRLGNQLFQYAFARNLQLKYGGELVLDFMSINKMGDPSWGDMLKNYQVAPYHYVDLDSYLQNKEPLYQRLLWKIFRRIKESSLSIKYFVERWDYLILRLFGMYYMDSWNCSNHVLKPLGNIIWCRGWFESSKFFEENDDIIKSEFVLKSCSWGGELKELHKTISVSQSLCVLIRRGDFIGKSQYDVCTMEYYMKAINYICLKWPVETIFICCDDIEWAKANIKVNVGKVFFQPANIPSWEALSLASSCKYFVISNSTFAWWAQHLSSRTGKVVVAPKEWRHEKYPVKDIYEENWVCM